MTDYWDEEELDDDWGEDEPKRHTWKQEEARMLSPLFRASDAVGNEWRLQSLCAKVVKDFPDTRDWWFAPDGTIEARNAVDNCYVCPVRLECLEWACTSKQKYGIWGGLSESIRIQKGPGEDRVKPHSFEDLSEIENPYDTDNSRSRFYWMNLENWETDE